MKNIFLIKPFLLVLSITTGCSHSASNSSTSNSCQDPFHCENSPTSAAKSCPSNGSSRVSKNNPTVPYVDAPDALQYNLKRLNDYRRENGVGEVVLDQTISGFAKDGNKELAETQEPHGHFVRFANADGLEEQGFCGSAAENQAPGWPGDDIHNVIDRILASMMAEGPGGGHHDNILNPDWQRVGLAVDIIGGQLYLTNDFTPSCAP